MQTLVFCSASVVPSLVIGFFVGRAVRNGVSVRVPLPLLALAVGLLLAGAVVFVLWWRTPRH